MADTNCELCHERPGHAIADAWLCDICEKIMDPDVMAFYREQNKADQASLMARLGAAERERDEARADIYVWKKRYFDAGRSEDAFAADMARLMVGVFKKDETPLKERDAEITRLRAELAEAERKLAVSEKLRAAASQSGNEVAKSTLDYYAMEKRKARTYEKLAASYTAIASRQRRTIRALVVAARAMWRCHMEMAYIDSSVGDYVQWISEKVCEVENEQAERGQAGKGADNG